MKNSLLKKLENLVGTKDTICLSISLPTHRTFPDNKQDSVLLKNLVTEAENNLINRFGKREVTGLLEKLESISENIDFNQNLDSLHVFISENHFEIIRLPLPIKISEVIISESFNEFYITKALQLYKEYLVLVLTQSGTKLYDAMRDTLVTEIENDDFPFEENHLFHSDSDKISDAKQVDNLVREYFNRIDKAIQKEYNANGLPVVVIGTPRNYQHLLQVSDNKNIYFGNSPINYNDMSSYKLGQQSWDLMKN